ncbi:MAG: hypothetical protein C4542_09735 [Dehalococcoidia bacterium]|nr:MAG: hypothetical protein C4542_09735 [Dehalococcoidia bacterium]
MAITEMPNWRRAMAGKVCRHYNGMFSNYRCAAGVTYREVQYGSFSRYGAATYPCCTGWPNGEAAARYALCESRSWE